MTLIDKAEALLPCPFCGSTMQVAMRDAMLCLECYAAGPQDEDRKTAWNRRALPARGVGVKPDAAERAKVAKLVEALTNLPAVYAHQINTGVREVYDPLQRFYTMESVLTAITEAQK